MLSVVFVRAGCLCFMIITTMLCQSSNIHSHMLLRVSHVVSLGCRVCLMEGLLSVSFGLRFLLNNRWPEEVVPLRSREVLPVLHDGRAEFRIERRDDGDSDGLISFR